LKTADRRYIASIKRILNLNAPVTDIDAQDDATHEATSSADGAVWKVLVFDEMGRDVISSVLRVNDLRGSGVWHTALGFSGYILSVRAGHDTSEHRHNATLDPRCMWHIALK
jgi:hypothetical protein